MPPNAASAWRAIDDREEFLGRRRAEGLEVHVHRGQLWLGLQGEDGPVVVTRDGDVVGYPPAKLVQGDKDAGGDLVGTAQHGIDVRAPLKQGGRRGAGPAL